MRPSHKSWRRDSTRAGAARPRTVVSVERLESRVLLAGVSAGFLNSNFWGAAARVFPADPDLTDGATPGNADSDAGSISLDGVLRDPADPTGIAARDPDVSTVLAGDASGAFRLHFDAAPQPLAQ
jgi:hypothetical protein